MDFDPATTLAQAGPAHSDVNRGAPSRSSFNGLSDSSEEERGQNARSALEDTLADLDGGAGAVACSTGAAALSTLSHLFETESHILCPHHCRVATKRLFSHLEAEGALSVSYEDVSDPEALTDAVRPNTEALWVETPSTPLLHIADLEVLSAFAEAHDLLLIVDNSVLSPVLQRPLEYGADLVVYSSLQHLNGHSDAAGGALIADTETLATELESAATTFGTAASSFDSWLLLRGTKTLPVRIQQQERNARSVVHVLDEHPAVECVYYPGLRDHTGHDTARKQQDGYGGMVSFVVDQEAVDPQTLLRSTNVFTEAKTLGGVQSSIEHPATTTHASFAPETRGEANITESLFRLSVGIESTDDLIQDLEQAFAAARVPETRRSTPTSSRQCMPARVGV